MTMETALDQLSKVLEAMGLEGKLVFGYLILLTTIPPLPLYSTLIVLAGYTFGVWEGFAVSYIASLVGAVLVFLVSRTLLRDVMTRWYVVLIRVRDMVTDERSSLSSSPTSMSLLQIIPANPHLLLLIRVAPYPYNLLNVILASAPSLTLRTYTGCTALSLIKLLIHTWIGAGIHDLSETYTPEWREAHWHMGPDEFGGEWRPPHMHRPYGEQWTGEEKHRHDVKIWSTWVGIGLCVALFFYLTRLAKKALARAQLEQEREVEERGVEVGDVAR
jgi:uncharacterized membrane protein YdjX (TVP38/TMEM64 family)